MDPHPVLDRREALRRVALLLGGAVSAPAALGVLAGCAGRRAPDGEQGEVLATIAEHIIPTTDTPGAREAGVAGFVQTMLAEYYPAAERERFLAGLSAVDERARRAHDRRFLDCAHAERHALLARLDGETFGGGAAPNDPAVHFWRAMKELTLLGYYTSEVGATRELRYDPIPGRYDPCVTIGADHRISAL